MTLHELFLAAERHVRELVEHVDLNFVPRADALVRMLEPRGGASSEATSSRTDSVATRSQTAKLVESERYTAEVYAKLDGYLRAIDASVARIVAGE